MNLKCSWEQRKSGRLLVLLLDQGVVPVDEDEFEVWEVDFDVTTNCLCGTSSC